MSDKLNKNLSTLDILRALLKLNHGILPDSLLSSVPHPSITVSGEKKAISDKRVWAMDQDYTIVRSLKDPQRLKDEVGTLDKDRLVESDKMDFILSASITRFSLNLRNIDHEDRHILNKIINPDLAKLYKQRIHKIFGEEFLHD